MSIRGVVCPRSRSFAAVWPTVSQSERLRSIQGCAPSCSASSSRWGPRAPASSSATTGPQVRTCSRSIRASRASAGDAGLSRWLGDGGAARRYSTQTEVSARITSWAAAGAQPRPAAPCANSRGPRTRPCPAARAGLARRLCAGSPRSQPPRPSSWTYPASAPSGPPSGCHPALASFSWQIVCHIGRMPAARRARRRSAGGWAGWVVSCEGPAARACARAAGSATATGRLRTGAPARQPASQLSWRRMPENPHAEHLQELLEGLNEPQREAVTHGEGPLLILAGAGSGKTRVLAHRIAFLIYTDQAQAGEILAITSTNKAASEMRERVERLLGHGTRGMWVMTFHAACARIVRSEAERLGYTRQFTIYDQADSRRLAKRSADAVGVDPKRFTPAAIHNQISAAKNRLHSGADYRQAVGSPFEEMVADVYEIYERDVHRMNAMDFDDLLFRTVNLLELFPEVRERYSSTFRHVLVDEYQDTNYAQYRFLQLLVGGGPPPTRGEARPGDRPTYSGP